MMDRSWFEFTRWSLALVAATIGVVLAIKKFAKDRSRSALAKEMLGLSATLFGAILASNWLRPPGASPSQPDEWSLTRDQTSTVESELGELTESVCVNIVSTSDTRQMKLGSELAATINRVRGWVAMAYSADRSPHTVGVNVALHGGISAAERSIAARLARALGDAKISANVTPVPSRVLMEIGGEGYRCKDSKIDVTIGTSVR